MLRNFTFKFYFILNNISLLLLIYNITFTLCKLFLLWYDPSILINELPLDSYLDENRPFHLTYSKASVKNPTIFPCFIFDKPCWLNHQSDIPYYGDEPARIIWYTSLYHSILRSFNLKRFLLEYKSNPDFRFRVHAMYDHFLEPKYY